ncbi:MAG: TetR/AcrR family transcriptional regulator [Solirubrobacteraceae bacterium]
MAVPGPRRARKKRVALSEAAIVEAALRVLKRSGLDAVTMRAVADELDTGAASLYVYVKGRDDLLGLMFDEVAGMIDWPKPDPTRWREQIVALSLEMLETLEAFPGIASLGLGNVLPMGANAMDGAEAFFALLLASGAEPQRAAWASDTLFLIISANAVETMIRAESAASGGPGAPLETLSEEFAQLDPERYPNVERFAKELAGGVGRERFLFSVETLLDGLVAKPTGA